MGGCNFATTSFGKTVQDAYANACGDANARNGHQEGYSGDIQTTDGYVVIERRGRKLSTIEDLVLDNPRFSKRGPCAAIVLKGKDAKAYRVRHNLLRKKGVVVFFCGMAAC
jgi:hypothetical protein